MTRRHVVLSFCCVLTACRRNATLERGVDDGSVQRYQLQGVVVRRDESSRIVTIKHGAIVNTAGKVWMEPMTMEFPVPNMEDFAKLTKGSEVKASVLARDSDLEYWIEGVVAR